MLMSDYIEVAVNGPLKRTFTYKKPPGIGALSPGQRLLVPFGRVKKVGFYLGSATPPKHVTIKSIDRLLDQKSYFPAELFKLCLWIADYYFANPADCLTAALPPLFKKRTTASYYWTTDDKQLPDKIQSLFKAGRKLAPSVIKKIKAFKAVSFTDLIHDGVIEERFADTETSRQSIKGYRACETERWYQFYYQKKFQPELFDGLKTKVELIAARWTDYQVKKAVEHEILLPVLETAPVQLLDFIEAKANLENLKLNDQQQHVVDELTRELDIGFSSSLLHGVTGSGKTLVYCFLCRELLQQNKTALILTPEIALTSTTLAYFRGFFGDNVTVIHSAMTDRERLDSFNGIRSGRYSIVVGPRSAVFAPLENLGLIIVDEEHDSSYKQDDPSPRFHGRDCAVMRAKINNIPVLLGSASPSLESYHNAKSGRYQLFELSQRPGVAKLPTVRIVDMKTDRIHGDLPFVSYPLKKDVETRLNNNEQVILFLNRRGYSPQIRCSLCGHVPGCPNCQVKLTFHKKAKKLTCHYCGHVVTNYDSCEKCQSIELFFPGAGTQKVEEELSRLFDNAKAIRLDSDSADGRKKAYEILQAFSSGDYNLLLGTQMVTKGLDMPGVTLVGVLSADLALDLPEFRAGEKAFSRLLQVAGRSGRADKPGEVLIQTYNPDNAVIQFASAQDYHSFYEHEISSRKDLSYPPFARLVNFIFSSKSESSLERSALHFREQLLAKIKQANLSAQVLGPAPCPFYYLRGNFRRHLFVKTKQVTKLVKLLTEWELAEAKFKLPSIVRLNIDVDPDDML